MMWSWKLRCQAKSAEMVWRIRAAQPALNARTSEPNDFLGDWNLVDSSRAYVHTPLRMPVIGIVGSPITTMPWAVKVYERICRRQEVELGRPVEPTDYVFMTQAKSRDNAIKSLAKQFDIVLDATGLKVSNVGEPRSLYSLRHSSIMFRLMFGRTVDTLTIARNARTSPEMIDRFYAAPLQGEMNIGELQSKRRPRPWE